MFSIMMAAALASVPYGQTEKGEAASLYRLESKGGVIAEFTDYGARLVRLYAPDRFGNLVDVTLGFNDAGSYDRHNRCIGTSIGRFGNRIANGKFSLDGKEYVLPTNNAPGGIPCCLHGGPEGWDRKIWKVEPVSKPGAEGLKFSLVSPDGDQGFPGEMKITVTHWLSDDNVWAIDYRATTDKKTVINMTNHAYFNLRGAECGIPTTEGGQTLQIFAKEYTEVTPGLIPIKNVPVAGTPFDFTKAKAIGADLAKGATDAQLQCGSGWYDHNFVLDKSAPGELSKAAEMRDPVSGRVMQVWTTEPCMQFYGGQGLSDKIPAKTPGKTLCKYAGIALETQHAPDSPNRPDFPTTTLEPGQTYASRTEYRFFAE